MHENTNACETRRLSADERWAHCVIIYEHVKNFRKLEEDENFIDLQLEELTTQKQMLRAEQQKLRADALQAETLSFPQLAERPMTSQLPISDYRHTTGK